MSSILTFARIPDTFTSYRLIAVLRFSQLHHRTCLEGMKLNPMYCYSCKFYQLYKPSTVSTVHISDHLTQLYMYIYQVRWYETTYLDPILFQLPLSHHPEQQGSRLPERWSQNQGSPADQAQKVRSGPVLPESGRPKSVRRTKGKEDGHGGRHWWHAAAAEENYDYV